MINSHFYILPLICKSAINEVNRTSQRFFQLSEVPLTPKYRSFLSDFKYLMFLKWFPRRILVMCCFQVRGKKHEHKQDTAHWPSLCSSAHQLCTSAPCSHSQGRSVSLPGSRALSESIFLVIHNSGWEFHLCLSVAANLKNISLTCHCCKKIIMLTSTVSRVRAHAIHRGKAPHFTVPYKEQVWAAFMEKSHGNKIFPGTQAHQPS